MTARHPAALSDEALLTACLFTRGRTSGPGGQHRNKVETLAVLTHRPTGIRAQAGERRSQHDNKRKALFRLRLRLAMEVRGEVGSSAPSELWRGRCRGGRIAVNPKHADYPALLAEALDHLAAADWIPGPAADALSCSQSQLVKLVKAHPPAFVLWNEARAERGLHPLR